MHFYFEIKVTLCFEIQKNSMNNIINISEDSLSNFKQAKPGACEVAAILSLQMDHFLALVYILHLICVILCTERMLGVASLILSHTTLMNEKCPCSKAFTSQFLLCGLNSSWDAAP